MPTQHLPAARALATDGVITRAALSRAALNTDLGDRLHRAGAAQRLAPSTYLLGLDAPCDAQLVLAALAHAGEDAVITGAAACRAWGVGDAPTGGAVDVLVPAGRRRVSTALVRVQPTTRPPAYWTRDGVRYAEPCRAVVDAARRMTSLRDVRALTTAAVGSQRCDLAGLQQELDSGPRRGSALCRRALSDVADGARSAPEAELAAIAVAAARAGRIPPFLLNPTLLVDGVVVGKPDGWCVGLGLGWEVESRRHHAGDDDFDDTLARHDRFGAYGLQLLHVTPRRLRLLGPAYGDVLAAAVAARRAASVPEPPGLVVRPNGPLLPRRRGSSC